ncbi:ALF repeat-containing protein [Streptomyces sp. 058-1L]|uniref:ALF repeat-containing protein n=1 Tax=Streptomyces sp. 058-1L TaxID=2789266 RepID=UPI003980BCC7
MRSTRVALAVTAGALAPVLLLAAPAFAAPATSSPVAVTAAHSAGAAADSPYDDMDEHDLRIEVFRILGAESTGRAVHREAVRALEGGTVQHLLDFLKTGRWIAQAEDDRVAIFTILADPGTSPALRAAAVKALEGTDADRRYFVEIGQYEVDGMR